MSERIYKCAEGCESNNLGDHMMTDGECNCHNAELATLRERVRELEALIASLKDPNVVWVNMLRGDIGFPKHLREADAKLHELGEANEAMHRLHAARMQECLEESKAKDARIRELEAEIQLSEVNGMVKDKRIRELEEINQAMHPDNAPTDCWPVVVYMPTEKDRDDLLQACLLERPAMKAHVAVYRNPKQPEEN